MFLGAATLIGFLVLGFFLYRGIKTHGDLNSYLNYLVAKSVSKTIYLSPAQVEMVEQGNYDAVVQDLQENITQEQIDCAVGILGEERAAELAVEQNPTPSEILKLSKCY
jgi:hypothetical protein